MQGPLAVIILTYNESIHIRRCINSIKGLASEIYVIDSHSTDETCQIANELGAIVKQNRFVNQAQQFSWAINECNVNHEWILRLDADEVIDTDLVSNIKDFIGNDGYGYNGAILERKHFFLGKWIKYGGRYPVHIMRLFRKGTAHIEQRWMDEHIVLDSGTSTILKGGFSDDNLNPVSWFIDKHNKYATREMVDIKLKQLDPSSDSTISESTGFSIRLKRALKQNLYMKLPYFVRPVLYFFFRYLIQLGFLDGARGFAYHFMQGLWYRALVDLKCLEVDIAWRQCSSVEEKYQKLEELTGYSLGRK